MRGTSHIISFSLCILYTQQFPQEDSSGCCAVSHGASANATVTRYELIQKSSTSTIQRVVAAFHGGHTSAGATANVQYVQYDRNALTCSCFAQAPANHQFPNSDATRLRLEIPHKLGPACGCVPRSGQIRLSYFLGRTQCRQFAGSWYQLLRSLLDMRMVCGTVKEIFAYECQIRRKHLSISCRS